MDPDLAIYLPAEDPKPSAALAEASADLIRGRRCGDDMVSSVACRLGIDAVTAAEIVRLACATDGTGMEDEGGE
jgi:hypothetical protein